MSDISSAAVAQHEKKNPVAGWFNSLFIAETNNTFIQFFRSLFVGGVATVADFAILIIFRELFHTSETVATVFGFIAGLTVNYVISTFEQLTNVLTFVAIVWFYLYRYL